MIRKKTQAEKLSDELLEAAEAIRMARLGSEETKRTIAATRKLIAETKQLIRREEPPL